MEFGFYFLFGTVGGYQIAILSIDGESTPWWRGERGYAVTPGAHVARYHLGHGLLGLVYSSNCSDDLQFEAQDGKHYILEADTDREPVEVLLRDKQTNVVVTKSACKGKGRFR